MWKNILGKSSSTSRSSKSTSSKSSGQRRHRDRDRDRDNDDRSVASSSASSRHKSRSKRHSSSADPRSTRGDDRGIDIEPAVSSYSSTYYPAESDARSAVSSSYVTADPGESFDSSFDRHGTRDTYSRSERNRPGDEYVGTRAQRSEDRRNERREHERGRSAEDYNVRSEKTESERQERQDRDRERSRGQDYQPRSQRIDFEEQDQYPRDSEGRRSEYDYSLGDRRSEPERKDRRERDRGTDREYDRSEQPQKPGSQRKQQPAWNDEPAFQKDCNMTSQTPKLRRQEREEESSAEDDYSARPRGTGPRSYESRSRDDEEVRERKVATELREDKRRSAKERGIQERRELEEDARRRSNRGKQYSEEPLYYSSRATPNADRGVEPLSSRQTQRDTVPVDFTPTAEPVQYGPTQNQTPTYGLAAEYYNDQGQSVMDQPGVRLDRPDVIVGAQPHLMSPLANAAPPVEPSAMGQTGAAATFYDAPTSQANHTQTFPDTSTTPARPSNSGGMPASSATTYGIDPSLFDGPGKTHIPQGSATRPQSHTNGHQQNHPSSSSHAGMAALGAGVGLAAAAGLSHQHQHHATQSSQQFSYAQHRPGSFEYHRKHHGPLRRFVDFWRDPDGVARFEEYSEIVGICKYCFEPGTSSRDAPRKHNYRRRTSFEPSRIDKYSRYGSSDDESRRNRSNKSTWAAGALAAYAGKSIYDMARSRFGDGSKAKSARTTSSRASSSTHSLSSHGKPGRTYRGTAKISNRSHSPSILEDRYSEFRKGEVPTYGLAPEAFVAPESHGRVRHQRSVSGASSSSDGNRRYKKAGVGLAGAAIGAGVASMAKSGRRNRSRSPKKFNRRRYSSSSSSGSLVDISRPSGRPGFAGITHFFTAPSEKRPRERPETPKKKRPGFFSFRSVSSSSDDDLAFGSGYYRQSSRKPKSGKKHDHDLDSKLIGLGTAAVSLAGTAALMDKRRRPEVVAVKEARHRNPKPRKTSKYGSSGNTVDDDGWESVSESSGGDSALAYGDSSDSGTSKWGWRWGKRRRDRESTKPADFSARPGPSVIQPHPQASESGTSLPSMHTFYPIPTSDPSRFDAVEGSFVSSSPSEYPRKTYVSHTGPIRLDQPQPVAPVSQSVYTHPDVAPIARREPEYGPSRYEPTKPLDNYRTRPNGFDDREFDNPRKERGHSRVESTPVIPTKRSDGIDAKSSKRNSAPQVQFDLTQEQAEKELRLQKLEEEKEALRKGRKALPSSEDDTSYSAFSPRQDWKSSSKERHSKDYDEYHPPSRSWSVPVGAAIVAAGSAYVASKLDDDKSVRSREKTRPEDWKHVGLDDDEAPTSKKTGKRYNYHSDDDESTRRAREIARKVSKRVSRSPSYESYVEYFTPQEVRSSKNSPRSDASSDVGSTAAETAKARFDREVARMKPGVDPRKFPWKIPRLNLIEPTPIPSPAASVILDDSSAKEPDRVPDSQGPSRQMEQASDITTPSKAETAAYEAAEDSDKQDLSDPPPPYDAAEVRESSIVEEKRKANDNSTSGLGIETDVASSAKSTQSRSVEPTPELPESPKVEYARDSDTSSIEEVVSQQMAGGFDEDIEFAATLAAGAALAGFDPSIITDNPRYHSRSPPTDRQADDVPFGPAIFESLEESILRDNDKSFHGYVESLPSSETEDENVSAKKRTITPSKELQIAPDTVSSQDIPGKESINASTLWDREISPLPAPSAESFVAAEKPAEPKKDDVSTIHAAEDRVFPKSMPGGFEDEFSTQPLGESYDHENEFSRDLAEKRPTGENYYLGGLKGDEMSTETIGGKPLEKPEQSDMRDNSDNIGEHSKAPRVPEKTKTRSPEEQWYLDVLEESNHRKPETEAGSTERSRKSKGKKKDDGFQVVEEPIISRDPTKSRRSDEHWYTDAAKDSNPYNVDIEPTSSITSSKSKSKRKKKKGRDDSDAGSIYMAPRQASKSDFHLPLHELEPSRGEDETESAMGKPKGKGRSDILDHDQDIQGDDEYSAAWSEWERSKKGKHKHFDTDKDSVDSHFKRSSREFDSNDLNIRHDDRSESKLSEPRDEDTSSWQPSKQKRKDRRKDRKDRYEEIVESGIQASEKKRNPESEPPVKDETSRKSRSKSFLGDSPDIPSIDDSVSGLDKPQVSETVQESTAPITPAAVQEVAGQRDTSRPSSPSPTQKFELPPLTPDATRARRISVRGDHDINPFAQPSPTAVPLTFRRPASSHSSPTTAMSQAPSGNQAPTKVHRRPKSTEFKSDRELRPLWLVERHGSNKNEPSHEEQYPSLPSSRTTSRASSMEDLKNWRGLDYSYDQPLWAPRRQPVPLQVDTSQAPIDKDILDSKQVTPTAETFQQEQKSEKPKYEFHSPSELLRGPFGADDDTRLPPFSRTVPTLDEDFPPLPESIPSSPLTEAESWRTAGDRSSVSALSDSTIIPDFGHEDRTSPDIAPDIAETHDSGSRPSTALSTYESAVEYDDADDRTPVPGSPISVVERLVEQPEADVPRTQIGILEPFRQAPVEDKDNSVVGNDSPAEDVFEEARSDIAHNDTVLDEPSSLFPREGNFKNTGPSSLPIDDTMATSAREELDYVVPVKAEEEVPAFKDNPLLSESVADETTPKSPFIGPELERTNDSTPPPPYNLEPIVASAAVEDGVSISNLSRDIQSPLTAEESKIESAWIRPQHLPEGIIVPPSTASRKLEQPSLSENSGDVTGTEPPHAFDPEVPENTTTADPIDTLNESTADDHVVLGTLDEVSMSEILPANQQPGSEQGSEPLEDADLTRSMGSPERPTTFCSGAPAESVPLLETSTKSGKNGKKKKRGSCGGTEVDVGDASGEALHQDMAEDMGVDIPLEIPEQAMKAELQLPGIQEEGGPAIGETVETASVPVPRKKSKKGKNKQKSKKNTDSQELITESQPRNLDNPPSAPSPSFPSEQAGGNVFDSPPIPPEPEVSPSAATDISEALAAGTSTAPFEIDEVDEPITCSLPENHSPTTDYMNEVVVSDPEPHGQRELDVYSPQGQQAECPDASESVLEKDIVPIDLHMSSAETKEEQEPESTISEKQPEPKVDSPAEIRLEEENHTDTPSLPDALETGIIDPVAHGPAENVEDFAPILSKKDKKKKRRNQKFSVDTTPSGYEEEWITDRVIESNPTQRMEAGQHDETFSTEIEPHPEPTKTTELTKADAELISADKMLQEFESEPTNLHKIIAEEGVDEGQELTASGLEAAESPKTLDQSSLADTTTDLYPEASANVEAGVNPLSKKKSKKKRKNKLVRIDASKDESPYSEQEKGEIDPDTITTTEKTPIADNELMESTVPLDATVESDLPLELDSRSLSLAAEEEQACPSLHENPSKYDADTSGVTPTVDSLVEKMRNEGNSSTEVGFTEYNPSQGGFESSISKREKKKKGKGKQSSAGMNVIVDSGALDEPSLETDPIAETSDLQKGELITSTDNENPAQPQPEDIEPTFAPVSRKKSKKGKGKSKQPKNKPLDESDPIERDIEQTNRESEDGIGPLPVEAESEPRFDSSEVLNESLNMDGGLMLSESKQTELLPDALDVPVSKTVLEEDSPVEYLPQPKETDDFQEGFKQESTIVPSTEASETLVKSVDAKISNTTASPVLLPTTLDLTSSSNLPPKDVLSQEMSHPPETGVSGKPSNTGNKSNESEQVERTDLLEDLSKETPPTEEVQEPHNLPLDPDVEIIQEQNPEVSDRLDSFAVTKDEPDVWDQPKVKKGKKGKKKERASLSATVPAGEGVESSKLSSPIGDPSAVSKAETNQTPIESMEVAPTDPVLEPHPLHEPQPDNVAEKTNVDPSLESSADVELPWSTEKPSRKQSRKDKKKQKARIASMEPTRAEEDPENPFVAISQDRPTNTLSEGLTELETQMPDGGSRYFSAADTVPKSDDALQASEAENTERAEPETLPALENVDAEPQEESVAQESSTSEHLAKEPETIVEAVDPSSMTAAEKEPDLAEVEELNTKKGKKSKKARKRESVSQEKEAIAIAADARDEVSEHNLTEIAGEPSTNEEQFEEPKSSKSKRKAKKDKKKQGLPAPWEEEAPPELDENREPTMPVVMTDEQIVSNEPAVSEIEETKTAKAKRKAKKEKKKQIEPAPWEEEIPGEQKEPSVEPVVLANEMDDNTGSAPLGEFEEPTSSRAKRKAKKDQLKGPSEPTKSPEEPAESAGLYEPFSQEPKLDEKLVETPRNSDPITESNMQKDEQEEEWAGKRTPVGDPPEEQEPDGKEFQSSKKKKKKLKRIAKTTDWTDQIPHEQVTAEPADQDPLRSPAAEVSEKDAMSPIQARNHDPEATASHIDLMSDDLPNVFDNPPFDRPLSSPAAPQSPSVVSAPEIPLPESPIEPGENPLLEATERFDRNSGYIQPESWGKSEIEESLPSSQLKCLGEDSTHAHEHVLEYPSAIYTTDLIPRAPDEREEDLAQQNEPEPTPDPDATDNRSLLFDEGTQEQIVDAPTIPNTHSESVAGDAKSDTVQADLPVSEVAMQLSPPYELQSCGNDDLSPQCEEDLKSHSKEIPDVIAIPEDIFGKEAERTGYSASHDLEEIPQDHSVQCNEEPKNEIGDDDDMTKPKRRKSKKSRRNQGLEDISPTFESLTGTVESTSTVRATSEVLDDVPSKKEKRSKKKKAKNSTIKIAENSGESSEKQVPPEPADPNDTLFEDFLEKKASPKTGASSTEEIRLAEENYTGVEPNPRHAELENDNATEEIMQQTFSSETALPILDPELPGAADSNQHLPVAVTDHQTLEKIVLEDPEAKDESIALHSALDNHLQPDVLDQSPRREDYIQGQDRAIPQRFSDFSKDQSTDQESLQLSDATLRPHDQSTKGKQKEKRYSDEYEGFASSQAQQAPGSQLDQAPELNESREIAGDMVSGILEGHRTETQAPLEVKEDGDKDNESLPSINWDVPKQGMDDLLFDAEVSKPDTSSLDLQLSGDRIHSDEDTIAIDQAHLFRQFEGDIGDFDDDAKSVTQIIGEKPPSRFLGVPRGVQLDDQESHTVDSATLHVETGAEPTILNEMSAAIALRDSASSEEKENGPTENIANISGSGNDTGTKRRKSKKQKRKDKQKQSELENFSPKAPEQETLPSVSDETHIELDQIKEATEKAARETESPQMSETITTKTALGQPTGRLDSSEVKDRGHKHESMLSIVDSKRLPENPELVRGRTPDPPATNLVSTVFPHLERVARNKTSRESSHRAEQHEVVPDPTQESDKLRAPADNNSPTPSSTLAIESKKRSTREQVLSPIGSINSPKFKEGPPDIETSHLQGATSLFGGPYGLAEQQRSISPPKTPLAPIREQGLMDSSPHTRHRDVSDVGSPDRGLKVAKLRSKYSAPDFSKEIPEPRRQVSQELHRHTPKRGEGRSLSGTYQNILKTPEHGEVMRAASVASIASLESLRSTDSMRLRRSLGSGDLRAQRKAELGDRKKKSPQRQAKTEDIDVNIEGLASSSSYDPVTDKGKHPLRGMAADVYEGWGDIPGSPLSPSRPPSVRRRRSLQHLQDLESRLDQLVSENRLLSSAKATSEKALETQAISQRQHAKALETRDREIQDKTSEISQLKKSAQWLQKELSRLTELNEGLAATNSGLLASRAEEATQHNEVAQQWQQSREELEDLRSKYAQISAGMAGMVSHEVDSALAEKNAEIRRLRSELLEAQDKIKELQEKIIASSHDNFMKFRDEDYFEAACQKLCHHVQQWVLRFSKFSDMRLCRLTSAIHDEKIADRFENAVLDGSDVDSYLADRVRRRDVFMSVVMTMMWDYIFTRYLFGMDREQRQKLKILEKQLSEVGPPAAVQRWRATTLSLLAKRRTFQEQHVLDTEAVVQEIYRTLSKLLPPPQELENTIQDSLRRVMKNAVELSIEMRTQKAEYIMLPPLRPEYDTNGDLLRKVHFNATLMNERSGETTSNEELEEQQAVVRIVLFPLVVKKGNDQGEGDEEVVVCPAQVLIARPPKERMLGDQMSVHPVSMSTQSFPSIDMSTSTMI